MNDLPLQLPLPDDTDRLGRVLAAALAAERETIASNGLALRLEGNLGAGKTTLMRAMLRALGFEGAVKSPTFSLLETYAVAGMTVNHFDFYRFESPEEFEDAGFRDLYAAGAVCASEWSEKAEPFLPAADLAIELKHVDLGRTAHLAANTGIARKLLDLIEEGWNDAA